jgi:DNA-binding response OmpR family regulator
MSNPTIELRPALTPARRGANPAPSPAPAAAPQAAGAHVWRVLVVDDNAQVRSAVTRFLRLHAFHVEVASDGRAALAELAQRPADFVLLDVDMPGMNGFEVCRRIKADPANAFTPVIMLTALDSSEDRVRGAEAGADGYLAKPVAPAELVARVKAGVKQRELVLQAIRIATAAAAPRVQPPVQQAVAI